jgi:hypothetical protein
MRNVIAVGVLISSGAICGHAMAGSIAAIPGATQDGIKVTTTVGTVALRLPLDINTAGKNFYVTVDDFRGPDSRVVKATATVNDKPDTTPIIVSQTDRPVLGINAVFASAGEYTSNIVIFHDGLREPSIPIVITRQLVATSIQVDPIDSVALTLPPFQCGNALIHVPIRETAGQSVTLNGGELISFVTKDSDRVSVAARYSDIRLAPGAPELTLGPQGYKVYPYLIKDLREPGEYAGTFRIGSLDRTPIDKPISIFVKDSGGVAFLFIFLGVLASYLIRYWTKEGRPKLEVLRRIADVSYDLDEVIKEEKSPGETENNVFLGIRGMLSKSERNVREGTGGSQDSTISELETKVKNLASWLTLGNELDAVTPPEIVATSADNWKALADSYFLSSPADAGAFTKTIDSIKADIAESLKDAANKQLEDFHERLVAFKTAHPNTMFLKAAEDGIADASLKIQTGKTKEALSALENAKAAYARAAADSLQDILAGIMPLGFTQDSWQQLGGDLNRQIPAIFQEPDATKAIQLFDELNRKYIRAVADSLNQMVARLKGEADANGNLPPDRKMQLAKDLQTATTNLEKALAEVDNGSADYALDLYTESAALVTEVDGEIGKTGTRPLGAHTLIANVANLLSPMPEPLNFSSFAKLTGSGRKLPRNVISEWIRRYDFLLNVGFLIIATVLGLKLLWADSAVWGGLKDYVVAFLWGLGLQQIGASGLDGLPAITKKLTE